MRNTTPSWNQGNGEPDGQLAAVQSEPQAEQDRFPGNAAAPVPLPSEATPRRTKEQILEATRRLALVLARHGQRGYQHICKCSGTRPEDMCVRAPELPMT